MRTVKILYANWKEFKGISLKMFSNCRLPFELLFLEKYHRSVRTGLPYCMPA